MNVVLPRVPTSPVNGIPVIRRRAPRDSGGFRVPDVMAQSGALLREVGTTNRTRASDYAAAISDRTALILRVHPSNFRIEGFVERPSLEALVALGRRFGVKVVEDLGIAGISACRTRSRRCATSRW